MKLVLQRGLKVLLVAGVAFVIFFAGFAAGTTTTERVVEKTVEVPVEVEVVKIVTQVVEVPVEVERIVKVPEVVERIVEVTPTPTATPSGTVTPQATGATSDALATATQATAWVSIRGGAFGFASIQVRTAADAPTIEEFGLDLSLFARQKNLGEWCNGSKVFGGEWSSNLGCSLSQVQHGDVTRATLSYGGLDLRCVRHTVPSNSPVAVLACEVRT